MHALKLSLLIVIPLIVFVLVASPAEAYFAQPRTSSYQRQSAQPRHSYTNYGYQRDTVSQLTQANLNLVNNFTYGLTLFRPSFYYNFYSPFSYYGGYGYGWGY